MHIVIVGGGAAGTRAAIEIRKRERDAEITIINAQEYKEYSPCGMPFVLAGEVEDFDALQTLDESFYTKMGINLVLGKEVTDIDAKNKKIIYDNEELHYDKLILATGSYAFAPPIDGIDAEKVIVFKDLNDAKEIHKKMQRAERAVIIGAGLIGLETADALAQHDIEVTVVEMLDRVLPVMLDNDMARRVKRHLERHGFTIYLNEKVERIGEMVHTEERKIPCDLVVVAAGVRANIALAEKAGIKTDMGIQVNARMETSLKDVYACGDCVECEDFITEKPIMSQLATTAVRQAKIVAENIAGRDTTFGPVLNTAVTKLFGLEIGTTGLTESRAAAEGIAVIKGRYKGETRPEYMEGEDIIVKVIADTEGKVLGSQMIGEGLVGRMDAICLAILNGMDVHDLTNTEYCYAPPLSPEFEPMYLACEMAARRLK